jgi:hypothetical protein
MATLFAFPLYGGFSLLRLSPGSFTIETVGFLAYRVFPAAFLALSLVLALGWLLARRPPRLSTLTLAAAIVIHGCVGLAFFPQTYGILVLPLAIWSGAVTLIVGRLDWIAQPLYLGNSREGPVILRSIPTPPVVIPETPEPADPNTPPRPEAEVIQERFQRLREDLRPRPKERVYPQPSPLFLAAIATIAGVLSIVLLLPSAPSTLPLYGQQSEGFEAEPLWDPLLLASKPTPQNNSGESIPQRIWTPQARVAELSEDWEAKMASGATRAVFSKRSSLVRVENPGCVANVNPLMEFPEVSADGFALLPWNRGSMSAGSATGWQVWTAGEWTSWVRYSGDPRLDGAWPPKTRHGVGPWLGKVALQIVPGTSIVSLSSVNRLNVALSARQADLCSLTIEPMREAEVYWGAVPEIEDDLTERSTAGLHRTATAFIRRGHGFNAQGKPIVLEDEIRPRFEGWVLVRQPNDGPGYLICSPFWQRQIGIERPTHTPVGDPSNRLTVSVDGLMVRIRLSLVSTDDPGGSAVATLAPGTYLNVILLVPIQQDESNLRALRLLRETLKSYAPPLLLQETQGIIEGGN